MTRIVLTCSCGASIDAHWGDERSRWTHGEPAQLEQFRRDHRPCTKAAASRPTPGEAPTPHQEKDESDASC